MRRTHLLAPSISTPSASTAPERSTARGWCHRRLEGAANRRDLPRRRASPDGARLAERACPAAGGGWCDAPARSFSTHYAGDSVQTVNAGTGNDRSCQQGVYRLRRPDDLMLAFLDHWLGDRPGVGRDQTNAARVVVRRAARLLQQRRPVEYGDGHRQLAEASDAEAHSSLNRGLRPRTPLHARSRGP